MPTLGLDQMPKTGTGISGAAYVRPDIARRFKAYERIRDCLSGQDEIKERRMLYLPMPNEEDQSDENKTRYKAYLKRAVFYPAAQRTMEGLIGQVFMRDPTLALPPGIEVLKDEASGDGQSLEQVARNGCGLTLGYGRCGLFIDYPKTDGVVTAKQLADGGIQPTLKVFAAWHVPNWRSITRGGVEVLSLVVIWEGFEVDDDGFELKTKPQYRVLQLINNVYMQTIWQKMDGDANWTVQDAYAPTDHNGKTFDTIPFKFIGALNNNAAIDEPPIEGLVDVNLAHYRNSADYEESVFLIGQPTPVFAGLTEAWVKDVFKGGKVMLGSRSAVALPPNGSASILQAAPNTLVKEAMDQKERQMVALGAKLVQQSAIQRTATETELESTAENSVLSSVAKNVSAAILWGLQTACAFTGDDPDAVEYTLSTEFDLAAMAPEERRQLIMEWQAGAIAFTEMRANLRKAGIASLDDASATEAIAEETANALANAIVYTETAPAAPAGDAPQADDPNAPPSPTGAPTPAGGRPVKTPALPPKAGVQGGGKGKGKGTKT